MEAKKLSVVTGASGHLGAEIVKSLLRSGSSVLAVARDEDGLGLLAEKFRGSELLILSFDLSNDGLVEYAFEISERRGEHLYGWVNNAHTRPSGEHLGELTRGCTEESVKALSDTILLVEKFAQASAERGREAAIVNVASMYGLVSPNPHVYAKFPAMHNPPVYGAVKAGILQFTRYAAVHYAQQGIRVNSVSPGPFPKPNLNREFISELARLVPMQRLGLPSELGEAVGFLLSSSASFITGHNLVVDGGWTAW